MNSNVCVVTIIFLSLENVAGLICFPSGSVKPSQPTQPPTEKPKDCDTKGTQDFTCNSQKLCDVWYQGYQNGSLQIATGNIPPQKWGKRTRFTIRVEEFDNNTEIYCENSKEQIGRRVQVSKTVNAKINSNLDFDSNNEPYKNLIKIEGNESWETNEEPTILYSNENQNVSFSCPEPSNTTYIQLGIINTTSNIIKTFDSTHEILNTTHNGTILCCIYYEVNETAEEMWITRVVANKTLLHYYNDTVRRDSLEGKEIIFNTATTYTGTDSPADQGHQTIIITIAVAVAFTLLVIIATCKKRFRKKPQSDSKVLYADLDILRQIQPDSIPRPGPAEESPYAQIIGEMRSQPK